MIKWRLKMSMNDDSEDLNDIFELEAEMLDEQVYFESLAF